MIVIDGSQGEGGGQIVRSSLALSLLTRQPFRIENVRAGRAKPGLMRQHLTAVKAATEVGNATVTGAELGSRQLSFTPGSIEPGNYDFRIGTAGSITLVFQTVLPALMLAAKPSTITLTGGTHNMMAPTCDYLARSYLPQLEKMGPRIDLELRRYGFYPAGGGEMFATVNPVSELSPFQLIDRGRLIRRRVQGIVSALPVHIAERECARIRNKINWDAKCFETFEVKEPQGPGNVVVAELEYENISTVFSGFGRKNASAEKVADEVIREIRRYLKHDAPVGPHLADQILLPMAIGAHFGTGGGAIRTAPLTRHSKTHLEIIQRFLDVQVATDVTENEVTVEINSAGD